MMYDPATVDLSVPWGQRVPPDIVFRGFDVKKAGPADEARDEHGRWTSGGDTSAQDWARKVGEFTDKQMGKPKGWAYGSTESLVAANGRAYIPAPLPKGIERGPMKLCFQNAFDVLLSHPELTYVEGYASTGIIPVHHAWLATKDGDVVDPTWPDGVSYFGVPLTAEFVMKTAVETGHYGVFGALGAGRVLLEKGLPPGAVADSLTKDFNPDEARDEHGRWTSEGGGGPSDKPLLTQLHQGMYLRDRTTPAQERALKKAFAEVAVDAGLPKDTAPADVVRQLVRNDLEAFKYAKATGMVPKGEGWYRDANGFVRDLAAQHNITVEQAAAITARFSPQNAWAPNQELATRFVEAMDNARNTDLKLTLTPEQVDNALKLAEDKPGVDPDALRAALSAPDLHPSTMSTDELSYIMKYMPTGNGDERARGYMLQGMRDSIDLFRGDKTPEDALKGTKIRSFFNNIANPDTSDHVTIDRHQVRISTRQYGLNEDDTNSMLGSQYAYFIHAEATRIAAGIVGMRPNAFQAATWSWYEEYWGGRGAEAGAGKTEPRAGWQG